MFEKADLINEPWKHKESAPLTQLQTWYGTDRHLSSTGSRTSSMQVFFPGGERPLVSTVCLVENGAETIAAKRDLWPS